MRTIETNVYHYAELTDEAKEKARDWWRKASAGDNDFAEFVTDDFKDVLKAAGFSLDRQHNHDVLYWSGFSSQGDGACFGASWRASDVAIGPMVQDRPAAWTDKDGTPHRCESNAKLATILEDVEQLAVAYPEGSGCITANDRYNSTRCEGASAADDSDSSADEDLREKLEEIARDLANFFYRSLEAEYEYQNSDEVVAETIEANQYEFTEDGEHY